MRHLRNTLTDGTELYLDYQGLHVRVQEPMSQSRALTVNLQRPANAAHFSAPSPEPAAPWPC